MAELRSVSMRLGGQCVMTSGTTGMQVLSADNLDIHHMVGLYCRDGIVLISTKTSL